MAGVTRHVFGPEGDRCTACGADRLDDTMLDMPCVERAPIIHTSETTPAPHGVQERAARAIREHEWSDEALGCNPEHGCTWSAIGSVQYPEDAWDLHAAHVAGVVLAAAVEEVAPLPVENYGEFGQGWNAALASLSDRLAAHRGGAS